MDVTKEENAKSRQRWRLGGVCHSADSSVAQSVEVKWEKEYRCVGLLSSLIELMNLLSYIQMGDKLMEINQNKPDVTVGLQWINASLQI